MSGSSGCDVSLLRDFDTGGHLNMRTYRAGIDAGSSIDQMASLLPMEGNHLPDLHLLRLAAAAQDSIKKSSRQRVF